MASACEKGVMVTEPPLLSGGLEGAAPAMVLQQCRHVGEAAGKSGGGPRAAEERLEVQA